jgi:hypothetical protein
MNIYYEYTKIDESGKTCYELYIYYKSYIIDIYFIGIHLPHKRLAKNKPFNYFMKIPSQALSICVSFIGDKLPRNNIESVSTKSIIALIERSFRNTLGIGFKEGEELNILFEFYKSL